MFLENGVRRHRTQFATTFVMSTYVTSLTILPDDYQFKETEGGNNVKVGFIYF